MHSSFRHQASPPKVCYYQSRRMRPWSECHITNTQLPQNATTFLLSLDDTSRLCNEVGWILLASLRKLLSSVGWWRRFLQVPFTRSNIIMAWVQRGKVQRRSSRRTWLPPVTWFVSGAGESAQHVSWLPSFVMAEALKGGNGWQWVMEHIWANQRQKGEKKQLTWRSVSNSPCVWLWSFLTILNHCVMKEVTLHPDPFSSPSPCRSNIDAKLTLLRFSYLCFICVASYRVNLATELC